MNILRELKSGLGVDLPGGSLEGWARQGVLLAWVLEPASMST